MALSEIWRCLPGDLAENILSQLVDTYFHRDPAITLYAGAAHKFEYALMGDDESEAGTSADPELESGHSDAVAAFAVQLHIHHPLVRVKQESKPGKLTQKYTREARASYDRRHTGISRCGLGKAISVLAKGKIRFRWKDAVNELLREEMYMREVGDEMPLTLTIQVEIWRCHIQFARCVAVLLHRAAKSKASPRLIDVRFSAYSANLHKQQPDPESVEVVKNQVCCALCSRNQYPDIFEIVLTGILELFRDEYALSCELQMTDLEEGWGGLWEDIRRFWNATKQALVNRADVMQGLSLGHGNIKWALPP
ncbi:hypothetical protein N657DRAFT_685118 [Parathielavia appendiculata]|uniref:Uncharacterized protein n=1 Tax=Parathielavia appendiculata TaxID=2587402 RepID=A0AAN6YYS9_9PEZI|nr:hypothetical protein N657DRAFT_685118 [Parathielavia appendiculata]